MLLPDVVTEPPLTDDDLEAMFAWQDCEDGLDEDPVEPPVAARWKITSTDSAEWAMRKLAHLSAEIASTEAQAEEFRRQIKVWEDGVIAPLNRRAKFFEGALISYLNMLREFDPDKKSVKLPSGTIGSRNNPSHPAVTDEVTYIEWAKDKGFEHTLKVTVKPIMKELKAEIDFRDAWVPDGDTEFDFLIIGNDDVSPRTIGVPRTMDPASLVDVDMSTVNGFHVERLAFVPGTSVVVPGVMEVPENVSVWATPAKP